jgi:glycerophosphoryl diester phosphodiesterase
MKHRRVSVLVLACLILSGLLCVAAPAEAKGMNLHKGSHGASVRTLEHRLARLGMLPSSAVDGRFRAATVHAVRNFQWRLGMRTTGRVSKWTWKAVAREPARRAAAHAPRILGHRGEVTSRGVENTLAAMRHAARYVDFLEFDLARTADHELVLMHDLTLNRTTNCTGKVASWTAAALRARCRVHGQPIPTFDEVAGYAASVGKPIAPELKNTNLSSRDMAKVVSVINAHGLADRTWVQSTSGRQLASLRGRAPSLRLVLVSRSIPSVAAVRAAKATVVAVRLELLNLPRVRRYHSSRVQVWAFTAQTRANLQMARAMRAEGVVANVPATARAVYH